ncbi:MAG: TonB-dependent receptor [Brevundimonas sp.]|nr:MAG: TonB-dependent receptor [Brevundimonas sp.]
MLRTRYSATTLLKGAASAMALAMVMSAGSALAQEAQPATPQDPDAAQVDDVIVTGFRASLQSATNIKRRESGVVDAIVAEDIAAFPDMNLAESLQRIPGVAITRVGGEGRQISVRGLGPDYTRVRINGMEALATSGGTSSGGAVGNNRGRGFDFNIFASELFNSLTVRKSASADVEEGSLGATVDLSTSRPFDYREPTLVAVAQMGYNDFSKNSDPRFAVLGSRTFMDGKLGVLGSIAFGRRNALEELHGTTQWGLSGANNGFSAASTLPGYTTAQINSTRQFFHPRNPSFNRYEHEEDRLGVTAGLQYRPSDRTLISINGLYGKLDGTRNEHLLQAIAFSRGAPGKPNMIIRDGVVDANNDLVYGLFDNVDMRSQSSYHELSTTFTQITGDFTHDFSDRFRISGMVGQSKSDFDAPTNITVTFERIDTDGYSYDYRNNDRVPEINLGFDPTNPANWDTSQGNSALNIDQIQVINTFDTAKFEAAYDVNDNLTLRAGVDVRNFGFEKIQRLRAAAETNIPILTPAQIAQASEVISGFGDGLGLTGNSPTSWLVPNIAAYAQLFPIYSNTGLYAVSATAQSEARGGNGEVQEDNTGAFIQADFNFDLMGIPVRGDAGLRYLRTEQSSVGFAAVGTTIEQVSAERTYEKFLPSLNLAFEITDEAMIRFAAAKTIARPGLGSLSPGGDISVQGGNRSYSTGNPNLDPTESINLDLAAEWYPTEGGLVSLGVFYKDISTFVQNLVTVQPYNTLGLPLELLVGTIALPTDDFQVNRPVNSEGGELKGIELNVQQQFTFLPGFWSNFGGLFNYTYVTSDIAYLTSTTPGAPTVTNTLVGLSKNAANGTLYYEDDAFSIRGSVSYRSAYLTGYPGSRGNTEAGTNATLNFDMQASYQINDALQVSVEAINLTDEFDDRYVDATDRPWVYSHTGRQFYVGLRYTY